MQREEIGYEETGMCPDCSLLPALLLQGVCSFLPQEDPNQPPTHPLYIKTIPFFSNNSP